MVYYPQALQVSRSSSREPGLKHSLLLEVLMLSCPDIRIYGVTEIASLENPKVDFMISVLSEKECRKFSLPAWVNKERHIWLPVSDFSIGYIRLWGQRSPGRNDIQDLLRFSRQIRAEQENSREPLSVYVHCWMGISRSTASAYILLCDWLGEGNETQAAQMIREIRPIAFPNRLMVSYADDILERHGSMKRAIKKQFTRRIVRS
jgi:predicted protein tyrosine phosphatase